MFMISSYYYDNNPKARGGGKDKLELAFIVGSTEIASFNK